MVLDLARLTTPFMFALAGAVMLGACKTPDMPTAEGPQPVRVTTVVYAPLEATRSYTGTVKARVESDLGFRIAGKITERLVDVGRKVKQGDVLARLDATDLKLILESQEAELRAATSSREQATSAAERYRQLLDKGHVSTAAYEQRTAAADEARERVEKAVRAIATAKNQVGYGELKADADGVVAALPVDVGQVVAAGQTVARLARFGELEAQVAIPEQQLDDIRKAPAQVELWSNGTQRYAAVLREVAPEADPSSRSFQARFMIVAPDARVALGMTATVLLQQGSQTPVALLPLPAVMNDGRGASVYALDDSGTHIKRTPVSLVSFGREDVIVASGIAEGQRVVTLGTHLLDEARPVRIVETVPNAAATRSAALARTPPAARP
jgi:membrane fusion protein, multidrug efflux system